MYILYVEYVNVLVQVCGEGFLTFTVGLYPILQTTVRAKGKKSWGNGKYPGKGKV